MAFTVEQLAALESAAASGQLEVQLGDRKIRYQSASDLLRVIKQARADVRVQSNATSPFRQSRVVFND